jgi:hypothetical protein
MISVVALLCAAGIAPAKCTRDNAIDVVAMSHAANELFCMQDSSCIAGGPGGAAEYWRSWNLADHRRTGRSARMISRKSNRYGPQPHHSEPVL